MVYFLETADKRVKIGTTNNLMSRMNALRRGVSGELTVLGIMRGGYKLEKELHKKFQTYAIGGEWFEGNKEIYSFIANNGEEWGLSTGTLSDTKYNLAALSARSLKVMGDNIKLARIRRGLTLQEVAKRSGLSKGTVVRVEQGDAQIILCTLMAILAVLNLEYDMSEIGAEDQMGRAIQDSALLKQRVRAR